ncbi:hypothetical protein BKA66DRAFT_577631 [Pyrenochaeta sp. MPI-SDFR-AT-0127]|nr:hypothetical protein BKA66DRAFT_577631 [Pyrenochaeta sp. MPI-SDFR-AT-0127]
MPLDKAAEQAIAIPVGLHWAKKSSLCRLHDIAVVIAERLTAGEGLGCGSALGSWEQVFESICEAASDVAGRIACLVFTDQVYHGKGIARRAGLQRPRPQLAHWETAFAMFWWTRSSETVSLRVTGGGVMEARESGGVRLSGVAHQPPVSSLQSHSQARRSQPARPSTASGSRSRFRVAILGFPPWRILSASADAPIVNDLLSHVAGQPTRHALPPAPRLLIRGQATRCLGCVSFLLIIVDSTE